MGKSKKKLNRKPQKCDKLTEMGTLDEILARCAMDEVEDDELFDDEMEQYICEYNDFFAAPGEDEIPRRRNYPKRELGAVRDLVGREDDELTELIRHVVNDEKISLKNRLINLKKDKFLEQYYDLSELHDTVNQQLDYDDVLERYVNNMKYGLLDLPDELSRERTLLIFSFQDMLGAFLNAQGERERYHDIIGHALIDTIRKLADGKTSGEEAKEMARELEIKLEGFNRLNENISDYKYFEAALELEDHGYPGRDERLNYDVAEE